MPRSPRCSTSSSSSAGWTSPATSAPAWSAASAAGWSRRLRELRRLPRLPRGASRRVRAAVRDAAHQRHRVLPRPAGLAGPAGARPARDDRRKGRRRADPRLERRLRERTGGIHARDGARRAARRRRLPRAGEDLRDRRRRGRARAGAPGALLGQGDRGRAGRAARALLRARRPALGVPQGPSPHGDLRAQQPDPGRADLAPGPAGLPQHADVLQRRDPGPASCATSTSRCATRAR